MFFKPAHATKIFISLIVALSVGFGGFAIASDDFKITYPEKNEEVRGEIIEIEGTGAIQGTVIEVSVLTNDWYIQDGKAEINKNGTWTYAPCYLSGKGKFNNHTIKARLLKDGEVMATTKVRGVVRK